MRDYLNVLDIAELPPTQRRIMRLLLRKVEMTYSDLCAAVDAMPEPDRLSRAELDQALETLKENRWVVIVEKSQLRAYRVNLRRAVAESEPVKRERKNIWDALSLGDETASSSRKPDFGDF